MKKYIYISLMALVAIVACSKEEKASVNTPEKTLKTFTALTDTDLTKTSLSESFGIVWSKDDDVTVFPGANAAGVKFDVTSTAREGLEATLSGSCGDSDVYYALSPAQAEATITGGVITASLETNQGVAAGSFGSTANLSVARSTDKTSMQFKNVGAIVGITVGNKDITGLKLETIDGEALSGTADINATSGEVTSKSGENYVQMSGSLAQGSTYYFVVLPGTYDGGFRVTLFKSEQFATFTKAGTPIERNGNLNLGTFTGSKWKNNFTPGEAVTIQGAGAAEAGQSVVWVGETDYFKTFKIGSDTRSDIADYTSEGVGYNYEIFTRLTGGEKFYFQGANGAIFTLTNDGTAVKQIANSSSSAYTVPGSTTDIYRIRMVFPSGTAEVKKIDYVRFSEWAVTGQDLEYIGNGTWYYSGIALKRGSNDWDNRYKFNVRFSDGSNQFYGRMNEGGNPTYGVTAASYFYVQPSTDDDRWEPCFKFPTMYENNVNRYYGDVTLYLNNDNTHYTHEITNILDSENLADLTAGDNLFIKGSGANEAGQKFAYNSSFSGTDEDAIKAPVGYDYEIFTQLTKEAPVFFEDGNGNKFTMNAALNALTKIALASNANNCAWENGVYRIRIKSSDLSASVIKLNSIEYMFCPTPESKGSATYDENGVWVFSAMQIPWNVVDWSWDHYKDTRYNFKFTYEDSSSNTTYQYFGNTGDDSLHEETSGDHYNIQPVSSGQWSGNFKAPYSITDDAAKDVTWTVANIRCDIKVYLNATNAQGAYTHTWEKK